MAIYYVRQDGNDSNTGLGSTTALAWRTIQKALGATGIGSGDTLYIAPGLYNEQVTIGGTYSTTTSITGDPTAAQFIGVNAGRVQVGSFTTLGGASSYNGSTIVGTSKNNLSFSNIEFLLTPAGGGNAGVRFITSQNISFNRCTFLGLNNAGAILFSLTPPTSSALNLSVTNCIFQGTISNSRLIDLFGQSQATDSTVVKNCLFIGGQYGILVENAKISAINCTFIKQTNIATSIGTAVSFAIQNCLFYSCQTACSSVSTSGIMTQTYSRFIGNGNNLNNVATSVTSSTTGSTGFDTGYQLLTGLNPVQSFSTFNGSPNTSFGNATNADATDLYGVTWSGTSPDAGSATFRSIGAVGQYLPTERNASAITIAPGSTSQSIELYLGATGLTFSTSGLAAYYVRNQSAPVAITLVTQTPTGAWASGGFAEISSSLVPGVYRLDVPNAAFAAGASDVTIVVRGASGTNGAVLTVTLSSGGLTAAQTAAAVWDEARASHTTAGTFGEYVNAELVTPVTSAALVRMGPFEVRADGLGASDPLDIQKGAQHGIDIQCVDNNGAGIDITSATVTAKVYNSGATLVDTYSCTATYAADGRATFTIDTTVTNVPGTYTATITRTTGASDTQIFGPLRIYVRDI